MFKEPLWIYESFSTFHVRPILHEPIIPYLLILLTYPVYGASNPLPYPVSIPTSLAPRPLSTPTNLTYLLSIPTNLTPGLEKIKIV